MRLMPSVAVVEMQSVWFMLLAGCYFGNYFIMGGERFDIHCTRIMTGISARIVTGIWHEVLSGTQQLLSFITFSR